MSPLNSCTKLEYLRLDLNEIQNIQVFDSFKNLKSLYLASNRIKDIFPLQSDILGNLESLSLQLNEIIDISSIGNLASRNKITYLNLAHNRIFELPNFEEYEALNSLYLDSNYIDNIENLSKLKTISTLQLDNNKIKNIEALESLNTLSIQNNRLKNFPNDFKNKNCTLDITDNFIQSKSSLKDFKNLKSDFQLFDIDVTPDNKTNPTKIFLIDSDKIKSDLSL